MDVVTTPGSPAPARINPVWRIVLIVVAVQALLIVLGTLAFAALGLTSDGTGGCGGG